MLRRINRRVVLSTALVLVHLAGVSHMAFVAHTLTSSGAVVEVAHHAPPAGGHHHDAGSICERSNAPESAWTSSDTCEAVTSARTSVRPLHPPVTHVDTGRALVSRELRTHETAWTPPPLLVAPKCSPPSLG